jgi:hypothetical protein
MAGKMLTKQAPRAKRYGLHVPVYFREPGSPTWLEGTTENVSHSGVLFQSSLALSLNTALELRLQVVGASKNRERAEIRSKGVVVRVERRDLPETPSALAVAMRDCRILSQPQIKGSAVGKPLVPRPQDASAPAGC